MPKFDPEAVERYSVHITELLSGEPSGDENYVRMVYADKYDLLLELYSQAKSDLESAHYAHNDAMEMEHDKYG